METAQWFAVYTRPRFEKKVAERLTALQIECYCPLQKVEKQWSDRKKVVEEPLFTSYVFVKITWREQLTVRKVPGVLNFVYWLGKPAVIRKAEIAAIRELLSRYRNIQVGSISVSPADRVEILEGAFARQQGRVLDIRNNVVRVAVSSLGFELIATVAKDAIHPTDNNPPLYNQTGLKNNAKPDR